MCFVRETLDSTSRNGLHDDPAPASVNPRSLIAPIGDTFGAAALGRLHENPAITSADPYVAEVLRNRANGDLH